MASTFPSNSVELIWNLCREMAFCTCDRGTRPCAVHASEAFDCWLEMGLDRDNILWGKHRRSISAAVRTSEVVTALQESGLPQVVYLYKRCNQGPVIHVSFDGYGTIGASHLTIPASCGDWSVECTRKAIRLKQTLRALTLDNPPAELQPLLAGCMGDKSPLFPTPEPKEEVPQRSKPVRKRNNNRPPTSNRVDRASHTRDKARLRR